MFVFDVLFILIVVGCGLTSYALGRKRGIIATVGYLIDEDIIDLDDVTED